MLEIAAERGVEAQVNFQNLDLGPQPADQARGLPRDHHRQPGVALRDVGVHHAGPHAQGAPDVDRVRRGRGAAVPGRHRSGLADPAARGRGPHRVHPGGRLEHHQRRRLPQLHHPADPRVRHRVRPAAVRGRAQHRSGVLSGEALGRSWRISVFIIFLFTAIASPSPDVGSMLLMALPLVGLYVAHRRVLPAQRPPPARASTAATRCSGSTTTRRARSTRAPTASGRRPRSAVRRRSTALPTARRRRDMTTPRVALAVNPTSGQGRGARAGAAAAQRAHRRGARRHVADRHGRRRSRRPRAARRSRTASTRWSSSAATAW